MKRGRTGGRKILTIIIGGIIAGILAAIAIPLYTRYVETASVREGLGIIKAIMTSQKLEKSRAGKYYNASTFAEFKSKGIDLSDTKFYTWSCPY
jgi:Tfp pilus assembly major pilin PilA